MSLKGQEDSSSMANINQDQNHELMMIKEEAQLAPIIVIMVPFPAQGHLNLLLQLSRIILTTSSSSSSNIPVHFVGSAIHNRQTKTRASSVMSSLDMSQIQFHDFEIPAFESPPPNPNSHNKFPSHLQPSFEAAMHLREPFAALLRSLSPKAKRIIIIHDILISSVVQDSASVANAETYVFQSTSAFTYFTSMYEFMSTGGSKPFQIDEPGLVPDGLAAIEDCVTPEHFKFMLYQAQFMNISAGDILYTNPVIEGAYLDMIFKLPYFSDQKRKLWALGPFNPVMNNNFSTDFSDQTNKSCLDWLDKQAPNSVLYVSFGTTGTMTDEEIRELAIGLESSGTKFLWVLRDVDKGDVFTGEVEKGGLPLGFEERMQGVGMVVRDWAPQLEILGHPATGGFLCHCGWNSVLESISLGVPIAAWTMHSDHPRNAALVAQVLKIGVIVREWAHRHEMVTSSMVREAVKKLMASEEGDEMRRRVKELGIRVQQSTAEGGVSTNQLNSFIAHITR